MNTRRRLQREIIRHRRSKPYRPTFTRMAVPGGIRVRVVLAPPHFWTDGIKRADYHLPATVVYGVFPPTPEVLDEIRRVSRITCWWCEGWGWIEIFHPSTDAPIGHRDCPGLADAKRHPPAAPVPLAVGAVSAHDADCDGSDPWCCPPF